MDFSKYTQGQGSQGGASDYQSWRGCAAKGRQRAWQRQEQNINDTDMDEQEFGRADTGVLRRYSKFESPHEFAGRCMRAFTALGAPPWPSVASPSCGVPCEGGSEDQRARTRWRPKSTKDRVLHRWQGRDADEPFL